MLKIYDSLTKVKKVFKPIKKGQVMLYACGMTVYDYCHMGHARSLIAFDMVNRYLTFKGFKVKYVRNITDVDDKIIKRANETNQTITQVTDFFIQAMHEDVNNLGLIAPTIEPRATQNISEMVMMIENLVAKGYAYVSKDNSVYFDVRKFKNYGQLSHQNLDQLRSGARVEVDNDKHDPLDFVLWKSAKPGEPSWDSPWGKGRPGWHIECSVMATNNLANHIDIHGGGMDLLFPHHENERAQSQAATGETFVNYWMHGGYLQMDNEKMSKSLGNFLTIRDTLKTFHPEVVRFFMLSSHYRSPLNYSNEGLIQAKNSLTRLYLTLRSLPKKSNVSKHVESDESKSFEHRFIEVMDDDFNTPAALAVLFELASTINQSQDPQKALQLQLLLKRLGSTIGILQQDVNEFLQGDITSKASIKNIKKIETLINARNKAREQKDWSKADQIRQQLQSMNIILEDDPKGTAWRYGDS